MSRMPMLVREICYVPYSQANAGGTARQLGFISYGCHVYCSAQNLSVEMAGIDVKAYVFPERCHGAMGLVPGKR